MKDTLECTYVYRHTHTPSRYILLFCCYRCLAELMPEKETEGRFCISLSEKGLSQMSAFERYIHELIYPGMFTKF